MDPWSGELLAVANVPDFDPAHFSASSSDDWRDRAVSDAYEPGSTFKLITASAALESKRFRFNARFPARNDPQKSQLDLPRATGLIRFSIWLLSIGRSPSSR